MEKYEPYNFESFKKLVAYAYNLGWFSGRKKANAFPVDVFGLYKPDILLRQVIADFSSSFQKKMLMANVQVVMPLMPDTSSDTVVVLSEDTAKRGWYNLRLNIIIPDIKVKLLKNGRKPSIKKKLTTTKSS